MIPLSLLEEIVADQLRNFRQRELGVSRDVDFKKYFTSKQIVVISGVRRSGKSTLLKQLSEQVGRFYYINFDDERLVSFTVEDFQNLMIVFQKAYSAKTIFIDEVQNIEQWERFVRRIYEEGYKIFVTGSNARLLSSELATHLTGRYIKIELYPFSFKEFLLYSKIDWTKKGSVTRANILKRFDRYLVNGGFPEFVKHQDPEHLKRIYEDILYKDLLIRFKIREVKAFRELAGFLFANIATSVSYNALKNTLGFKSLMSVKNYIEFMKESYLVFEVYKYDYSLKKQFVSNKKVYGIDTGLRNTVAFSFSGDRGRLLENAVFLELRRRGKEVYFYKNKQECDFLLREKGRIVEALQVCLELSRSNETREINALVEAMKTLRLHKGTLLTLHQEGDRTIGRHTINIVPVWKWLLGVV